MSSSRRSKIDLEALAAALRIIDDGVGKIVAEIASHRDDLPADHAVKPARVG